MDNWSVVIITLLLSAFFSGMEIAFISANKLKIELDKNQGSFSGKILADLHDNASRFIGALLLGNNIALVIYGIAMAKILEPPLLRVFPEELESGIILLLMKTIISTLLILFTAEFLPKALFRINPNSILNLFAVPLYGLYTLLYPLIYIITGTSQLILKHIFRLDIKREKYVFSTIDLGEYLREFGARQQEDEESKQEIQMFQNAMEFRNIKLRECMVPRTEIVAREENASIEEIKEDFIETGHSKILIFRNSVDNIIGYVHSSDLFKNPHHINDAIRSINIFPETTPASSALTMLIRQHKSVAVVVDEFGGTSGMVSLEDIIEEIFGEIEDEYDIEEFTEKRVGTNEYIFSARLEIDYLNEKYRLNLPVSEDYETLGGLIISEHESIPAVNEKIIIPPFFITVSQASDSRIEQVKLKKIETGV